MITHIKKKPQNHKNKILWGKKEKEQADLKTNHIEFFKIKNLVTEIKLTGQVKIFQIQLKNK